LQRAVLLGFCLVLLVPVMPCSFLHSAGLPALTLWSAGRDHCGRYQSLCPPARGDDCPGSALSPLTPAKDGACLLRNAFSLKPFDNPVGNGRCLL
jgi:hypothetical protein